MAVNFYISDGVTEQDIETYFGLRVMSVRGLEPPTPKELYTRDWASENGVAYYLPTERKRKSSEVIMTIWIEDDIVETAIAKYRIFCDYVFDGIFTYRDTLQNMVADIIYNTNKPSWYQFVGKGQVMAEISFLNPSGAVTLYLPTP
jgi:hypothetical protein